MRLLLIASFVMNCLPLFSQVVNAEFDKVAKKFEKGTYESALESAEALMENDKHRKNPEPYLWASMCYYQIYLSDDDKMKERVKSPLKNALKYAGKAVSKDKNGNLTDANRTYFETMKNAGVQEAVRQGSEGDFRKAAYTYKQIMDFAPEDPFIQFAKGVNDIKMSSAFEAEKALSEAMPDLVEKYRDLDYEPDPISSTLLKPNMLFYIDYLAENAYLDSARKVTMSARVFFPLDEDIKQRLQQLD